MKLIIYAMLVSLSTGAIAQRQVKGVVIDQNTKETLIGAEIYLPDMNKGTVTDNNGAFTLPGLPSGKFTMEVSFVSYKTKVLTVDLIDGDEELNILMEPSAQEMKEVIVTGVSASTERKLSPIPAAVTNKEYLLHNTATNIIDAIAKQPGVDQLTTGQAISKPIIRGLGYNRVLTLYNGVR